MKIKVSVQDELMINQNLKKVLMNNTAKIYIIDEVTIEDLDVTSTTGLFKKTTTTTKERFITGVKIISYHPGGDFIGTLCDKDAEYFIQLYNLYAMRKIYQDFKKMLTAFGMELKWIPAVKEEPQTLGNWD